MANEDKATRYHRLQRRATLLGAATAAIALVALLVSGASAALRDAAAAIAPSPAGTVALCAAFLVAILEILQLPLGYYQGVTLERRYGLSTDEGRHWWIDRVKATGVGGALAVAASVLLYAHISLMPRAWWAVAAVVFTLLLALMAQVAPVLILPLFYRIDRLRRPELSARLMALAQRAGTDVLGVFEWQLGNRTRKANAVLAGLGRTRRILLTDTLLADHSDDEIEVILAHELAHHVHRDVWTALGLEAIVIACALFAADLALRAFGPALGLAGTSDPAGLPLIILSGGAVSLLLMPLGHALSRSHERRADHYALTMTGKPEAFVSAMRKLSTRNLAEERPGRLIELLFHSHPSTNERVEAARTWARGEGGGL